MSTDDEWEEWGRRDPYYGVFTQKKFRRSELAEESMREFFESGRMHVEFIMHIILQRIDAAFNPASILDFGCGVGRVTIPFAALAPDVAGLDVAPSMLEFLERAARH